MSDSSTVGGADREGSDRGRTGSARRGTGPATFYRQVVAELRKVVWPTREQLGTYFVVVMVFVLVMMTVIALLDQAFGQLIFAVFAPGKQ